MNNYQLAEVARFWAEHNRTLQKQSRKPEASEYFRGRAEVFSSLGKALVDPEIARQMTFTAECYGMGKEGRS